MTADAMKRWLPAVLLLASAAPAPAAMRGGPFDPDDARQHRQALRFLRGPTTPESLIQVLEATRRERAELQGRRSFATKPVQGNSWVPLGPNGSSQDQYGTGRITTQTGRVQSILPHPNNPDIVYVATAGGGVWKSYDATKSSPSGPHWEPITDQLGTLAVGSLAMDPMAPDLLYLGIGDPFWQDEPGITYSRDGGGTWADIQFLKATYTVSGTTRTLTSLSVRDIKVDPNNSSNVLAATDVGLFQSPDAGLSWKHVKLDDGGGVKPYEIWNIAWTGGSNWLVTGALPVNNPTTFNYPGPMGLWRSTDGAATWTFSNSSLPTQADLGRGTFAIAPSTLVDPATARVFLLAGSSDETADKQRDVFRSDDGGATFVALNVNASRQPTNPTTAKDPATGQSAPASFQQFDLNAGNVQATYNQSIAVDPLDPDTLFVGGQLTHMRSKDGGATWTLMSYGYSFFTTGLAYVHPDQHAIAISPSGVLWLGHDGGLSRSTNAFTATPAAALYDDDVNQGIVTLEPYSVACAPETWPSELQGFVVGGTQDNGTRVRIDNTTLFDDVIGGDGVGVAVSMDTSVANSPGESGKTIPAAILGGNFHFIVRSIPGTDYRISKNVTFDSFMDGLGKNVPGQLVPMAVDQSAASPQVFLTVTDAPDSGVYSTIGPATTSSSHIKQFPNSWQRIIGTVHAPDGSTRTSLNPVAPPAVGLRAINAFAKKAGVYGVVSNRYAFVTNDGGNNWYQSNFVGSSGSRPDGISRLSGISFDPSDSTYGTFYVSSRAYTMLDGSAIPDNYGHLFVTKDRGTTWQPVAGTAGAMLPNVPATSVLVDHGDASGQTIYVATRAGLYLTRDGGQHFSRFGVGLPLAEVTGLCLAPASGHLMASLWGRGFWQLDVASTGNPAGVRGNGDMNHDLRLDGFDLIDVVAALGTSQADDRYRAEADMKGTVNQIDDDDLTMFLSRFGGTP